MTPRFYQCTRQNITINVEAAPAVMEQVTSFISPYVHCREVVSRLHQSNWTIIANAMEPGVSNRPGERLNNEAFSLVIHPDDRCIVLEEWSVYLAEQRLIRVLRSLFQVLSLPEMTFVHGGLVAFSGGGIAFIGPAKTGKTSSVLAALCQGGAALIENDLLSFASRGNRLYGFGWPRHIRIRAETLNMYPSLFPPSLRQHWRETQCFTPQQVASTFSCCLASEAEVQMIIFPSFASEQSGYTLTRLAEKDALKLCTEHLVAIPKEPYRGLKSCVPGLAETSPFLQEAIVPLIESTPCYRLSQSFSSLSATANALRNMVQSRQYPAV